MKVPIARRVPMIRLPKSAILVAGTKNTVLDMPISYFRAAFCDFPSPALPTTTFWRYDVPTQTPAIPKVWYQRPTSLTPKPIRYGALLHIWQSTNVNGIAIPISGTNR